MYKYESTTMLSNENKTDHKKNKIKKDPEESMLCISIDAVSSKACINKIINILLISDPVCLYFLLLYGTTENYIPCKLKTHVTCVFFSSLYFSH